MIMIVRKLKPVMKNETNHRWMAEWANRSICLAHNFWRVVMVTVAVAVLNVYIFNSSKYTYRIQIQIGIIFRWFFIVRNEWLIVGCFSCKEKKKNKNTRDMKSLSFCMCTRGVRGNPSILYETFRYIIYFWMGCCRLNPYKLAFFFLPFVLLLPLHLLLLLFHTH